MKKLLIIFTAFLWLMTEVKAQWSLSNNNLFYNNGNIGIGTVNPGTKLHITTAEGNTLSAASSIVWIGGRNDQFDSQYINFRNPSITDANGMYWWSPDILFGRYKNEARWGLQEMHGNPYGTTYKSIITAFLTDDYGYNHINRIAIAPTEGNVLIGKTTQSNSSYKLDVAGKIRADEITVNTTGADFVFHPSYKLRSLTEVETFIKINQHLPEMASASQMQEEGVSVSEMQTKLLQKVEELTLYTIEQNKKLQEQQQINEDLKQQIALQAAEIQEFKKLISKK